MYVITTLEDEICVHPRDLYKQPNVAVLDVIQERYFDKVIAGVGLVVTVYSVLSIEGGFVYPNDGSAYFKVKFQLVVFRPFEGEVLVGKLKSCTKEGIKVSLGFFEDVEVPEYAMQEPSFFDDQEKLWVWKYDENDMYMDLGETVRLKVQQVKFYPPPTPLQMQQQDGPQPPLGTAGNPFSPMVVVGDINGDGLGLLSWWAPAED